MWRAKPVAVDWREGRAEALAFDDAVSQFGQMFFDDAHRFTLLDGSWLTNIWGPWRRPLHRDA